MDHLSRASRMGVKGHFVCPTIIHKECKKNCIVCQMGREHLTALKNFQPWYPQLALLLWAVPQVHKHFRCLSTSPLPDGFGWLPEALRRWEEWWFAWPPFSLHSVISVPKMSWIRERKWHGFARGPSLWMLTREWSTEWLYRAWAWPRGTLGWLTASPGMQLVWNAVQGPPCLTRRRTLERGRSFPKQREDLHSQSYKDSLKKKKSHTTDE